MAVSQGRFSCYARQPMRDPQTATEDTSSTGESATTEQRQGHIPDKALVHSGSEFLTRQRHVNYSDLCKECECLDLEAIFSRAESELPNRTSWNWWLDCPVTSRGMQVAPLGNRLGRASKFSCQLSTIIGCRLMELEVIIYGRS